MTDAPAARFGFPRIIVNDLQKQAAFYRAAFGYGEGITIQAEIKGRPIEEIIFMSPEGQAEMILLTYTDNGPPSSPSGVLFGFFSPDLDVLEQRVLAAGGSVFSPIAPMDMPSGPTRLIFLADPEGFVMEVIEQKAK